MITERGKRSNGVVVKQKGRKRNHRLNHTSQNLGAGNSYLVTIDGRQGMFKCGKIPMLAEPFAAPAYGTNAPRCP